MRRDDLAFARRQLRSGNAGRHHDVAEQREHRLEILGQTGADEREQMPRDVIVSVMPRLSSSSAMSSADRVGGAAIDHARQQIDGARRVRRIADRSGADRRG